MNQKNLLFFLSLFFIVFGMVSCKDEPDEIIPPVQNIIEEDTTGTMGALTVEAYYYKRDKLERAPYGTEVHLYENSYDLDNGISTYRFITTDSHVVYMGYLPMQSYYVLVYADIDGYRYERADKILIRQRDETVKITMEKLIENK